MALDPRHLRPAELVRLVNSTSLGEVLAPHEVYRQRNLGGYRIGDGQTVDLVRYVSWLSRERKALKRGRRPDTYEDLKERSRQRNALLSEAGRDIAPYPGPRIERPEVREAAGRSFRAFCDTYFADVFSLPWSPDHLEVIAKIEEAVLYGGLFALATPRGSGKTSLCEAATIWSLLFGHRRFVALIGSDEGHAMRMLETIQDQLRFNDELHRDFKEVTHPIRALEGIANRCSGQLFEGRSTNITWTSKVVVLPTMPDGEASGGIVNVAGLTGRIRGMKHGHPTEGSVRPDLVILDDPQTDESARSASQCATRESILAGAVLGLAGPGKKISGIMPCTVIRPGDMADRILDREAHPEWNGERRKMVYSFPKNTKLWDRYAQIRGDSFRRGGRGREATEFYREHRAEMDEGAEVAWAERHNPDELSAIQHAMNLRLQDEAAFWAEYQNEPMPEEAEGGAQKLDAEAVASKLNGRERGTAPENCMTLTAFVDVHEKVLFYAVCAWEQDFTGYVVDYGAYPDQHRPYFTARDAQRTLGRLHQGAGQEGAVYAGLTALVGELLSKEWPRDDGAVLKVDLCLIDQGWQRDLVHQFCLQSGHSPIVMPSKGQGITASQKPISEYDRKRGEHIGHNWWVPGAKGRRALRHVEVDTNFWKSFLQERLATAMGDRGCLSLWGRKAERHRLFAEHVAAEYRVRTEGRGRKLDEWKLPPSKPDNHWFDCLVGCAAAASMRGMKLAGVMDARGIKRERKVIRLSEIQRQKRLERGLYSTREGL